LYENAKENGISIPEDIAIVGFNNDAVGKIIEPQLTTIDYPGIDMGEIAAKSLIEQLVGDTKVNPISTLVVRSELIVRGSSLKEKK
jgi:LacI family transcriptional regulator